MTESAGKIGFDFEEAKKLLTESEEHFNTKNFEDSIKLSENAKNLLSKTKSEFLSNQAKDAISEAKNEIALAKEIGTKVDEPESKLKSAQKLFEDKQYEKCMENCVESKTQAIALKQDYQRKIINDNLDVVKYIVSKIKELEGDVTKIEEQLSAINTKLEKGYLEQCLEDAAKLKAATTKAHQDKINDTFTKLESSISKTLEDAKGIGADTSKIESEFKKNKSLFDSDNYEDAIRGAKENERGAMDLLEYQKTFNEYKSVEEELNEIDKLNIEIQEPKELMNKASSTLKESQYDETRSLVKDAKKVIINLRIEYYKQKASDAISKAKSEVEECKNMGIDVENAEKLIKDAEIKFSDEYYQDSIKLAGDAYSELNDTEQQFLLNQAEEALTAARNEIDNAKKIGTDMKEPVNMLKEAEGLLERKKYQDCTKKSVQAKNQATYLKQEYQKGLIEKTTNEIRTIVTKLHDLEGDTGEIDEKLKSIESNFNKGYLRRCVEDSENLKSRAEEIYQHQMDKTFSELETSIKTTLDEAKEVGADISEIESTFKHNKSLYDDHNYEEAIAGANDILLSAQNLYSYQVTNNELKSVEAELRDNEDLGIDSQEPKDLIKQATELLDDAKYEDANFNLKNAKDLISTQRVEHFKQNAVKSMSEAKTSIDEIKQLGIDVIEVEAKFSSAQNAFDEQEYTRAKKIADNSKVMAEDLK
ncbi:MAG: hypothetical protein JSW07_08730, partial [bacterium]